MAEIWAEVLGIDRVGIHDNFLDLGGHSLAATRIVTRVIDKFHLELPLQALFDSPTVEKMAAAITEHQSVYHQPGEHRSQQSSDVVQVRSAGPTIDFTPFPKDEVERSSPQRFEKIVTMYPDRIAVRTGNEAVTYSQLNAMANRMGHAIMERRGTEAEAVAILLDNGARLMAAMLAVLKAGKFFVLLDKSSPKSRLTYILEDSQAHLIISEREHGEVTRRLINADSNLLDFESISSRVARRKPWFEHFAELIRDHYLYLRLHGRTQRGYLGSSKFVASVHAGKERLQTVRMRQTVIDHCRDRSSHGDPIFSLA